MNKTELVAAMAKETNLSKKDVEAVLKSFIDVVSEELKKGEKVITSSGMVGKITKVSERFFTIEIAPNVQVDFERSAVTGRIVASGAAIEEKND